MGSTCPIERANLGGCPPTEKHCESLSHGATAAADCSAVDWSVSHYIATTEKPATPPVMRPFIKILLPLIIIIIIIILIIIINMHPA